MLKIAAMRLARDKRGATAVEFGLLALPFLAVIFAIFEIAYVDFEGEILQASINDAARQMFTGQMQASSTPITSGAQFLSTYLCQTTGTRKLPANFNCNNIVVDVRTATSFANGDTSNDIYKGTAEFCPGIPGQIVLMRVTYPLKAIFPFNLFGGNAGLHNDVPGQTGWFHILMGEALFVEENYAASYTPPAGC